MGHLPAFLHNYLQKRTFQVKFNETLSKIFQLINGIPQGGVVSSTLFILVINHIVKYLPKKIRKNLYVDDFAMYYAAKHIRHIERVLNGAIQAVYAWADTIGLKFAIVKTQGILFYRDSRWLKNQSINLKIG